MGQNASAIDAWMRMKVGRVDESMRLSLTSSALQGVAGSAARQTVRRLLPPWPPRGTCRDSNLRE